MTSTTLPETILAHPALAGRTLYLRRGGGWAAHDIHPDGHLGTTRPVTEDPAEHAWRGGPVR